MYWIFLIIFILAVMMPDIIQNDFAFIPETKLEELSIFLLGISGFLLFIFKERQLTVQKEKKEKYLKQLDRTGQELIDSYAYIGEVNRKMDILMKIALGISHRTEISREDAAEIYNNIISAAVALMKARCAILRFSRANNNKIEQEIIPKSCASNSFSQELTVLPENINIKKQGDFLVVSSRQKIGGIKSYLILCGCDGDDDRDLDNSEILKVLVSQALFIYAYMNVKNK